MGGMSQGGTGIRSKVLEKDIGVSLNGGTPKWMVYHGKLIKMDDLGVPLFSETPTWLLH